MDNCKVNGAFTFFPETGPLYIDPNRTAVSGAYVLALSDADALTFKRLPQDGGHTFLRALNPL